ncbi:MAG: putative inorganic carbon (HCO3(-)) transporter [Gammaproteobacteria bacterium]|jgi:putative inorganic carbon (HCO3(-)) transporter
MNALAQLYDQGSSWLSQQLFAQKLNNPLGFLICMTLSAILATAVGMLGIKYGALVLIALLAIPAILVCIFNPMFGIQIALVTSVLISWLAKYAEAPFGIALDALTFVMFFGLLINQARNRDLSFAKSPISIYVFVWVFYNVVQVLNPSAGSRLAWVFTVRSMAGLVLLYFIACYAFDNRKKVFWIIKFILFLAFASAMYGLKQEFFGFSSAEITWLYADEKRLQLIMQWSRLRVFSFFSDPTTFGIFMAYMGTFSLILATGPFKFWKRLFLVFAAFCMFLGMAFAGSRTPFVLVPFGFMIFTLLTLKKEIIIGAAIFLVIGVAFVSKSTNSAVIHRIQSAFLTSRSDDTMSVREKNRHFIQPYIYRHPVGYGLGSTGIWAERFTPDSFLAGFAHDSGFVRVAVELGWIGLIIQLLFFFSILRTGIYYYVRVRDPKNKVIYLAITVVMFQLILSSYPQEAVTILPTSLVFYCFLAILVRLKDYDSVITEHQAKQLESKNPIAEELRIAEERRKNWLSA